MHTPTGYYAAHRSSQVADDKEAGMTSKRMHRFMFDRNRKANPHMMQSADYHIYNMVAHQDPFAVPGGPDTQAQIIEECCGLVRRVRCPEIQEACAAPYQDDASSYVSGSGVSRRSYERGRQSPRAPGQASDKGSRASYDSQGYTVSERGSSAAYNQPPRRVYQPHLKSHLVTNGHGVDVSDAGSSYLGPLSARDGQGRSAAPRADGKRAGGSVISASAYSVQSKSDYQRSPRQEKPRARSTDGRGSMRSSRSGSEMRSDCGSRSCRSARSADGRARSADGRSRTR